MQFNRLSAFTLGVIITAASVGAVSFANAAGDATLKACANKTSGAMRYISKGSCKKTETSLSWSQMGPQGLPGVAGTNGTAGAKGDTGAAGAKGDTGTAGTNGSNGQNFYAVDATGKTLGPVISHCDGCNGNSAVGVMIDGKNWSFETSRYYISNQDSSFAYKDSSCTQPWFVIPNTWVPNPQEVRFDYVNKTFFDSTTKAFSIANTPVTWTGKNVYYWNWNSQTTKANRICSAYSDGEKLASAGTSSLYEAVEIGKPTYTAPLTIVAR